MECIVLEKNTSVELKAFTNHPSEWYACEVIADLILDCAAADVYTKENEGVSAYSSKIRHT